MMDTKYNGVLQISQRRENHRKGTEQQQKSEYNN